MAEATGVFISYGHDEYAALARRLKQDLEAEGFRVWMDEEGIRHHHDWEHSIEEGLKGSQWVVACLTPHAMRRPDGVCLDELSVARFKGLSIAPVMVREVEPPLSICRLQWLDMQSCLQRNGDGWDINLSRYGESLKLLLATLRGQHALDFEGSQSRLRDMLRPFDYGTEIDMHVPGFVGRDWLFEAFEAWLAGKGSEQRLSRIFWIQGGVGVGKSALAAMLAHRHAEVVGIHFCRINDSERSDPVRVLCSLAYQLATQIPAYRDALLSGFETGQVREMNSEAAFRALFVEPMRAVPMQEQKRVLVIDALDEAVTPGGNALAEVLGGELVDQLPPWLRLVVTSRPDPEIGRRFSRLNACGIAADDKRNRDDLLACAHHGCVMRMHGQGNDAIHATARGLAEKSGGSFLYLHMVFDEVDRGRLGLDDPEAFPEGLTGIYLSFFERQFPDRSAYKECQRPLLELVAAANRPLPVKLAETILDWDDYDADDALEPLGGLFPLKEDETGREVIVPFHRSVLEWLQDRQRSGRDFRVSADKGHERLIDTLYPAFEQWREGTTAPTIEVDDLFAFLSDSLEATNDIVRLGELITEPLAILHIEWLNLWRLWRVTCAGNDNRARERVGACYVEPPQSLGHQERVRWFDAAGQLFQKIGLYDYAAKMYGESLDMKRKLLGERHPGVVISMNNLAAVLKDQGRYAEAESLFWESLALTRELLGEHHPSMAIGLNNLANVRQNLGRYAEAEPLFRESLAIERELLGGRHRGVAIGLNNLGNALRLQGQYVEAEPLYRESVDMHRELQGECHPDMAVSLSNLAGVLQDQGRYAEAEPLFRESLALTRELLGEHHPSVATTLNNLAGVLEAQSRYTEAEPLYRESLNMFRELLGERHPNVAISVNNLSGVLQHQGRYAEAEPLCRKSLAMLYELLGEGHPKVTVSLNNLADVLKAQDKEKEAAELLKRVSVHGA